MRPQTAFHVASFPRGEVLVENKNSSGGKEELISRSGGGYLERKLGLASMYVTKVLPT